MPASIWNVYLGDEYGNRTSFFDNIVSGEFVRVVNDVGAFSVVLPGNTSDTIQNPDGMLEIWRRPIDGTMQNVFTGFVRKVQYVTDEAGNQRIVLSGYDVNDILKRRIIAYAAETDEAKKTDYADDMMKEIVSENLGGDATDTDRDITSYGFSISADTSEGPSLSKAFAWRNMLLVLQEIAAASETAGTDLYFGITPYVNGNVVNLRFDTYVDQPGDDNTNRVFFGLQWGNLAVPSLEYDYTEEENYIYAGGQGEMSDRVVAESSSTALINASVYNRREAFEDARNTSTAAALADRADKRLREGQPRTRFSGLLLDTPQSRYGSDWEFGDRVTAIYNNIQFDGLINAVRFRLEESGLERIEARLEVE